MNPRNVIAAAVVGATLVGGAVALNAQPDQPATPFGWCTTQPMDGQGWCRRVHDDGHTSPFPETLVIAADAGSGHCAAPFPCEAIPEYDVNLKR